MQHDDLFTVEQLCDFAALRYDGSLGEGRMVRLVRGGGHRSSTMPGYSRSVLVIDLDRMPISTDERWRVLCIFEMLAVDLGCEEAGRSLDFAGLIDTQTNGAYARRREGLPRAFHMDLWPDQKEYQADLDPFQIAAVKADVQAQNYVSLMNSSDRISYILTRESMLRFDRRCVDACSESLDRWERDRDQSKSLIEGWRRLLHEPILVVIATMLETSDQGQFIRTAHPQWPMTYTQERRRELLDTYFAEMRALRADPRTRDVPDVRLSRLLLDDSVRSNERYARPTKYPSGPFDFLRTR